MGESGRLRLKKLVLSQLPNTNQLVKGWIRPT